MESETYSRRSFILALTTTLAAESCKRSKGLSKVFKSFEGKPQKLTLPDSGIHEAGQNMTVHTQYYKLTHQLESGWRLSASDAVLELASEEYKIPLYNPENTHIFIVGQRLSNPASFLDNYKIESDQRKNNILISNTKILDDFINKTNNLPTNRRDYRTLSHFLSTSAMSAFVEIAYKQGQLSSTTVEEVIREYDRTFASSEIHPLSIWHQNPEQLVKPIV